MIFKILKLIITLALLYYLYIEIPWYELKKIISYISIDKFILSIFVQVLAFILLVLRWSVFFRNLKQKINLFKIFKYGYIGIMFNNILPSSIGGDFMRGFYITKNGVPMYKAIVTLLLDRFIGLYVVLLTSSYVFFHYRWKYASLDTVEEIIYLSTLLLTLLMIVFFSNTCEKFIRTRLYSLSKNEFYQKLVGLSIELYRHTLQRATMLLVLLYSVANMAAEIIVFWLVSESLGFDYSLHIFIIAIPIIIIISAIPISLGGLFVREVAGIIVFKALGVDLVHASSIVILFIPIMMIASLPGLYFYIKNNNNMFSDKLLKNI